MLPPEAEDLILMELEGFEEFREEEEVPYGLTPRGITKAVGISETEPYTTLNEMSEEGLIEGDARKITSLDRERNVYFLTEKGKEKEKEIWNKIEDREIKVKTGDEEKELKVKKLENHISGRNPIVKGLRLMEEDEVVDLTALETDFEVFVGRKNELNSLKDKLKSVKDRGCQTVLIEGKAGIGKTSLVTKLIPFSEELGFDFLTGTSQSETSDPYLPFKEAFSGYIEDASTSQEETGMAFMGAGQGQKAEDKKMFDAKKKETFYETTKYIKEIADKKPLVVFLDDLQWVDKATLDILSYMNDKLEDTPILFIGTYRPEDISEDHHLTEMMHRLGRRNRYEKIELEPLSYENTQEIVEGVLGKEDVPIDFIKRLHEKTEGNPLFIKESIRQMLDDGIIKPEKDKYPRKGDDISFSEMVQNVIERRVNRLDDQTIKIIEIGSVIGGEIRFDLLSKTADMDEIDLLDHVDMLIGNQLWEEDPNKEAFYFSHELIEGTVYNRIKGLKKKLLHKRVANNIEELYEDEIEEWYSDLARHYEGGEKFSKALDYYLKAGEKAEGVYANEDAIEMYEKALELSREVSDTDLDRINIIEKIAKAYSLLGRYEKAREFLKEGLDYAEEEQEKQCLNRKICDTYYKQSEYQKSLEHIEKGIECGDEKNPEVCKMLSIKGWTFLQRGELDKAREIFEKEKEIAESIDSEEEMGQVYHDLGTIAFQTGKFDEGIDKLKWAIEIREENDIKRELMKSLNNIGIAYSDKGDWENAEKYYERSLEVSEEMGDKSGVSTTLNNMAIIHSKRGEVEKAIEKYNKCLKMNKKIGDKQGEGTSLTNLGEMHLTKGMLDKAEDYIKRAKEIQKDIDDKPGLQVNMTNLGVLKQMRGDFEKAEEHLRDSVEIAKDIGSKRSEAISIHSLGELFTLKGDLEKAEDYFEQSEEIAKEIGSKDTLAEIMDGSAKLQRLKENFDKSETLHRDGIDISEEIDDEETNIINRIGLAEDKYCKGELEKSLEISKELSESVKSRGQPALIIRNNLVRAKAYREIEKFEDSEKILERTMGKIDRYEDRVWKGKALYEYGVTMSSKGNDEESIDYLKKALEIFEEIGMKLWKEKTEKELEEVR